MALTGESLEALLQALAPDDREAAGARYEVLRRKLHVFFATRGVKAPAEDLADETLSRVAGRVAQGVAIEPSIDAFTLGVARNIVLEHWKKPVSIGDVSPNRKAPDAAPPEDPRLNCLDECLGQLAPQSRAWVERFYEHTQGAAKIRARQRLAEELSIDLNALRVRMHRIRAKLETCVGDCANRNVSPERTMK